MGSPPSSTTSDDITNTVAERYTSQFFVKKAHYDAADRVDAETVGGQSGTPVSAFDGNNLGLFFVGGSTTRTTNQDKQAVRTNYTRRGTVQSVDGSYGNLVASITRRADGLVTKLVYGDSAATQTATTYDDRRRPTSIQTFRGTPALWSFFAPGGSGQTGIDYAPAPPNLTTPATNFQLLLEDTDIAYDEVGNPIELRDWREPSEWPDSSKPVTKKIEYDDLYRVKRMDYLYATPTGMDAFQSPFSKESSENWSPADTRRAKPAPHLRFTNRPNWQKFDYDWLGKLSESDDNEHGFYDRSLGTQSHGNANKPYQLSAANNSTQASGSGFAGNVTTLYDAMGNLTRLSVSRASNTTTCLSDGSGCNQYYVYDWDEVGRLVRARRWDSTSAAPAASATVPTATAAIDLRYRYDASDQRVIKRTYNTNAANQRHTLYLFGSLEVHRTLYAGNAYTVDTASLVPYAMANGVRLARLHYDAAATVPQVAGLPTAQGGTNTGATLHVLLELGDHLGSTGTVLDKVSSELVEKTGYLPFGARESDYRPSRWNGFREDYGFTGKEEDVEVGLTYFGKRFLSPQLGRWVSADPLAVHAPGEADFNLYAYVHGALLILADPLGLEPPAISTGTPQSPALKMVADGFIAAVRSGTSAVVGAVAYAYSSARGDSTEQARMHMARVMTRTAGITDLAPLPVAKGSASRGLIAVDSVSRTPMPPIPEAARPSAPRAAATAASRGATAGPEPAPHTFQEVAERYAPEVGRNEPAPTVTSDPTIALRGTNRASSGGVVTDRGTFRNETISDAWNQAAPGPNGGKLCPTCGTEVFMPPGTTGRDWDGSHSPSWTNREFSPDVTRPEVLDNYQTGVSLECSSCNRSRQAND